MPNSTVRSIELTKPQRQLLRRIVRDEAHRLGYGSTYHDYSDQPGGPSDWPSSLKYLGQVWRKLGHG